MGKACSTNGGGEERLLMGKPEGKRPLGRPRCRWVDSIRMDLGDGIWCCGLDWSAQDLCRGYMMRVSHIRVQSRG
jgi:hypothetical protein